MDPDNCLRFISFRFSQNWILLKAIHILEENVTCHSKVSLFTLSFERAYLPANMPMQANLLCMCLPRNYFLRSDAALWILFGPHNYFEGVRCNSNENFANEVILALHKILFLGLLFYLYFTWVISRVFSFQ
jgi:hypothetical protein